MTTIAVLGAHGNIGRQVVRLLAARGDTALGVIRREEQRSDVEADGGTPVVIDLEAASAGELATAIGAADAIIVTVGAGPGSGAARKRTVDYGAVVLAVDAAKQAGIDRFVLVSAIGVDRPLSEGTEPGWRAYVEAKRDADELLRASGLDWTILRPGSLTDDDATHAVQLDVEVPNGSIPRADVAELLVVCVHEAATIGKQWEVVSGSTPLREAITETTW